MINTSEGNHTKNFNELLDYLAREMNARGDLAIATMQSNPERSARESAMETHYRRMYEAAKAYKAAALVCMSVEGVGR